MAEGSFFFPSLMRSKAWDSECVTQHNPAVLVQELIKHQKDLAQKDFWTQAISLFIFGLSVAGWGCLRNKAESLTLDKTEAEFYPMFTFTKMIPPFFLPHSIYLQIEKLEQGHQR